MGKARKSFSQRHREKQNQASKQDQLDIAGGQILALAHHLVIVRNSAIAFVTIDIIFHAVGYYLSR